MIWFYSLLQSEYLRHSSCAVAQGPQLVSNGKSLWIPSTWFHSPCLSISFKSFDSRDKGNESGSFAPWRNEPHFLPLESALASVGWSSLYSSTYWAPPALFPGPALDAVEAAVDKAGKGSSPMKLMCPLLPREESHPGQEGDVFLYFLFRL